jgi:small subunit ribosomal protein S4e
LLLLDSHWFVVLQYKLCRVKRQQLGSKGIPYVATHDGRTIRYPDPDIHVNDTLMVNIEDGKIRDFVKFEAGNVAMVTGGRNIGRVGIITKREKHPGSYEIVHMKDTHGQTWATRVGNVFVIGNGSKPWVSLKGDGVKLPIAEEFAKHHHVAAVSAV